MNGSFQLFNYRAKAVLCMTLMLAMNVIVGCGGSASLFPTSGNTLIELTPDHPMTQALAGTPFSGATAVEINAATNQFRLVFPDGSNQITGTVSFESGEAQVKTITVAQGSKSATLTFSESQEITNIATSAGPSWQRTVTNQPAQAAQAPRAPTAKANNLEAYLSANADILQVAQQVDSQGASTTVGQSASDQSGSPDQTVKTDAAFWPLFGVLAVFAYPGAIFSTLYFILQVVVLINIIF